ncbi:hypothetical protein ACLKA7_012071 [Drosophila subpalustris]
MPRNLGSGSRLVDLGVVCLICLRAEHGFCSIYGQDLETPHMQIVDKIRSCSALQLERPQLSQLPDKICHGCRNELSITYRFQQKCLEAQKVFQSAATATLLLDVDKLQLEQQQQLKLPASLRIKRLETEPASGKLKNYNNDDGDGNGVADSLALVKKEDVVTTIVLQDLTGVASDNDDDKMIALGVDWGTDPIESEAGNIQELEQDLEQELNLEQKLEDDEHYKLSDEQTEEVQTMPCVTVTSSNCNSNDNSSNNLITNNNNNSCVISRNRRSTEPKICDICGNTYKYQHALNAHMRRHNNERPYPCEVCQKAFISNVELRRHMRVHTGQKPYGCHYCERRFSDFGSSKKHERIHTGERPYVCEVCNKGFAYAHVLSVHRRTHTGKKQFQCTQCDKGFTKKCYLATHLEQHRINQPNAMELGTTTLQRLPTRKQQRQQQQQQQRQQQHQQQHHLRYDDDAADVDDDDDYDDDSVSVGIVGIGTLSQVGGEQAKVLEECIVTNDFMFNDEDADETEHDMDDYHDAELDENEFQNVQHVKVPYGLVGDLLDADDLVSDTKYLME